MSSLKGKGRMVGMLTRREMAWGLGASTLLPMFAAKASVPASGWRVLPTAPSRGKQDDIFFIDGDHGWYGNGAGRVFGTSDGGQSWSLLWERPGTYVRALGFVDAQVGILGNIGLNYFPGVTDPNPLYRTADGGAFVASRGQRDRTCARRHLRHRHPAATLRQLGRPERARHHSGGRSCGRPCLPDDFARPRADLDIREP